MTTLNQFNLYSMNSGISVQQKKDEVDAMVDELVSISDYEEVANFVKEHFGDVSGDKMFEYPEINKQINVFTGENRVEICVAKNWQQYWSKGWLQRAMDK